MVVEVEVEVEEELELRDISTATGADVDVDVDVGEGVELVKEGVEEFWEESVTEKPSFEETEGC